MRQQDDHPRCRRASVLFGASLLVVFSVAPLLADASTVPLTRFELEDVYKVCNLTHRPGPAIVPCLIEQTQKIVHEKGIEAPTRRSEAATTKQIGQ